MNRQEEKKYHKDYYQTHKKKWLIPKDRREQIRRGRREKHQRLRKQCILLLGGKCSNPACLVPGGCSDTRCFHIDHKLNNGSQERRKWGNQLKFYKRVLRHLSEYQIFCANCNWIKRIELREDGRKI